MLPLPTLFISHGAPDLALHPLPARDFLATVATRFARPRAIVVASAHYDPGPIAHVTVAAAPRTIHDFGGFDPSLYAMHYRAPGAPELAHQMVALLQANDIPALVDPEWGFDHGAWSPLMLMYPAADIPVIEISIHLGASPAYHVALGRALCTLREEGVLLLGSGAITHNLRQVAWPASNTEIPEWASSFADWIGARLAARDEAALLDYRQCAPFARDNHPTDDHFVPLLFALGAAGPAWRAEQLHTSVTYGSLRMDAYAFH